MPKIAVNSSSAFSINTKALMNGMLSLYELANGITLLKVLSQAQKLQSHEENTTEQVLNQTSQNHYNFSKLDIEKEKWCASAISIDSSEDQSSQNKSSEQAKQLSDMKTDNDSSLEANPNSKEGTGSHIYDQYIEELRFKSTETKRKRVIYTCKYENWGLQYHKRWNLIDHIKTHLKITPYKWDIWGTNFIQKGNLKKHLRQHEFPDLKKRKAFQCPHWNKSYTERYNLTHHLTQKHGQTTEASSEEESVKESTQILNESPLSN